MVSQQQNIIQSTAMPAQKLPAYPSGATSPGNAALKLQQEQTSKQMALIGKSGGSKRRKYRGGDIPRILVPPVPSGTVNSNATSENYTELTKIAQQQATQSVYDGTKTQTQVAGVTSQQQALYSGKTGGSRTRRRKYKKGGYSPIWGCLSGGYKKRRKTGKSLKTGKRTKTRTRTRKCRKNKRHY